MNDPKIGQRRPARHRDGPAPSQSIVVERPRAAAGRRRTRVAIAVLVAAIAAGSMGRLSGSVAQEERPALVVLLVVDQMRADYVERFGDDWHHGLRRLLDEGAVFTNAAYPYFGTLTCAGHTTIVTGAVPATHGMVLDGWWDYELGARVHCTNDAGVQPIRYGARGERGQSARGIMVPTLADTLVAQLPGAPRVAAFALKGRAAIPLAGRHADAVAWFDDGNAWTSSTAYGAATVPFLDAFFARHPVEDARTRSWTRARAPGDYLFATNGHDSAFDRPMGANGDETAFYTAWKASPLADDYLADVAIETLEALDLGTRGTTDYLAVGFSAPDYIGHEYGPWSQEVEDTFLRLDETIGRLLEALDSLVGRDRYIVALSADHGVAPGPEWMTEHGFDAGRISRSDVVDHLNGVLVPFLGEGRHVVGVSHTEIYLAEGVYERLLDNPPALAAALDAIRALPGVARVYQGKELGEGPYRDRLTEQVALSYYPGRSGEIVMIPKPYWFTWTQNADHGTGYDYDTRVPLVLAGPGITAGRYTTPASPADIAPTLAKIAGVTLADADGRVLTEALSR